MVLGGLLLFGAAFLLLVWSSRLVRESGLPKGQVLASDTDRPGKPLYSPRYNLTGTPDYIVRTAQGTVPVEVKPGRTDEEPHESHLLQVLAYCLLLEEETGAAPPHGLLRYSTATFRVDYNNDTRAHIISVLEEMQRAAEETEVHRSHDQLGRCKACAYNRVCEEALE